MAAVNPLYVNLRENRKLKTVLTEYLYFRYVLWSWNSTVKIRCPTRTMQPLFQTNRCSTRFACLFSKHSKKHYQILIITFSAHCFLREATTTENGWKLLMTLKHFQASCHIWGGWWAMARSFPTSPLIVPSSCCWGRSAAPPCRCDGFGQCCNTSPLFSCCRPRSAKALLGQNCGSVLLLTAAGLQRPLMPHRQDNSKKAGVMLHHFQEYSIVHQNKGMLGLHLHDRLPRHC